MSNQDRPKGLLYHYTTMDGLLGILDSDSLRATHIRYLNDTQEFLDALEHLEAYANAFEVSLRPAIISLIRGSIPTFSGRHGAFVASFTDDEAQLAESGTLPGDRLSQWRAYDGGGKGFSMGFSYDAIDKSGCGRCWEILGSVAYLLACAYTSREKRGYFERVGNFMAEEAKEELAFVLNPDTSRTEMSTKDGSQGVDGLGDSFESIRRIRFDLLRAFIINATLFKNHAYFEEREWRIVVLPIGTSLHAGVPPGGEGIKVKFRAGNVGITPFIEIPLGLSTPDSPLRRIVVGPTPHMDEALKAVEMKLADKGIQLKSKDNPGGVEVVPSKIPYRNW